MYVTRHVKRDGTVECSATSVDDSGKVTKVTIEHDIGSPGKPRPKREIVYNFSKIDNNGKFLGRSARTRQIKKHIEIERREQQDARKGSARKTHSIPSELYWKTRVEQGIDAVRDHKFMKKVASEHGFAVR